MTDKPPDDSTKPTLAEQRAALREAAEWYRQMHDIPDVVLHSTGIPKGVYRFKTEDEADAHREACLKAALAGSSR